jgi:DNA-binding LytR/AlgR family response regulator
MTHKKPTCIIVDDEPIAIRIVQKYIADYPQLVVIGTFNSAIEAMQFLVVNAVDVIFLDIQMPKITGLDMLKSMAVKPMVIITTAHHEFALAGFALDVKDYLLKPFSFERFMQAVNKCMQHTQMQVPANIDNYIIIKQDKKFHKLLFDEIIYIESVGDYVKYFTKDHTYMSLQTIKSLESHLPESLFLRVHKSYIISIDHIQSFYGNVIEITNKEIPIGEAFKAKVKKYFEERMP